MKKKSCLRANVDNRRLRENDNNSCWLMYLRFNILEFVWKLNIVEFGSYSGKVVRAARDSWIKNEK